MSDQLNAGATSEKTRTLKTIHIIRSHIHSNKASMRRMVMMAKCYSGTWWAESFLIFVFQVRKNPKKKSQLSRPGIETQAHCLTDAHAAAYFTAVD